MDLSTLHPKGILHLGAGQGEEIDVYNKMKPELVLWVDANPYTIGIVQKKIVDLPNHQIAHALLSDVDDEEKNFYVSNNFGSSSMLKFKDHKMFYPTVYTQDTISMKTTTVDTLIERLKFAHDQFDVANLDLQGAELFVLRGMTKVLPHIKTLFIEVNFNEMYEGCVLVDEVHKFLTDKGFKRLELNDTGMGWGECCYIRDGV